MSKIVGIKLTHDAAVALVEDGQLKFCIELEKVDNMPRYTSAGSLFNIERVLQSEGVDADSVDTFVIDGWRGGHIKEFNIDVAPYHEHDYSPLLPNFESNPMACYPVHDFELFGKKRHAVSYSHLTGHVVGAYMTAPFAGDAAYCAVWDGGIPIRIYRVGPEGTDVSFIAQRGNLTGLIYGIMGYYAGPFANEEIKSRPAAPHRDEKLFGGRDKPGKLMSWIAKGELKPNILAECNRQYDKLDGLPLQYAQTGEPEHNFMRGLMTACAGENDADILLAVHTFLESLLVSELQDVIPQGSNLCFSGGCALNIKWNSALREAGWFKDVWVPPFPNDSGSAIGMAATEALLSDFDYSLVWDVYSGPKLINHFVAEGWNSKPMTLEELAVFLHRNPSSAVVFMHGRAEIGPRALGHRSILMNPSLNQGQRLLNGMKGREAWRPVAPIALESDAARIFSPGTPDPYMLYDHSITEHFKTVMPAIVHLDGTARLQTVGEFDCPVMFELLTHYKRVAGYGVLCNTSANLNGSGFFPDIESAMRWGKCRYVWNDGLMYSI